MSALGGRAGVNPLARREAVDHVARRDADASAAAARAAEASARDTAEAKTQDVALLEKLAAHLTETGFLEDVETFLGEHELRVDRSEDEGFNHATYAVYQEFVALAERNLEGFLKATGTSAKEFQLMCQDLIDTDAVVSLDGSELRVSNFLHAFIASWEFEAFERLVARRQRDRKAASHK